MTFNRLSVHGSREMPVKLAQGFRMRRVIDVKRTLQLGRHIADVRQVRVFEGLF